MPLKATLEWREGDEGNGLLEPCELPEEEDDDDEELRR